MSNWAPRYCKAGYARVSEFVLSFPPFFHDRSNTLCMKILHEAIFGTNL